LLGQGDVDICHHHHACSLAGSLSPPFDQREWRKGWEGSIDTTAHEGIRGELHEVKKKNFTCLLACACARDWSDRTSKWSGDLLPQRSENNLCLGRFARAVAELLSVRLVWILGWSCSSLKGR